MKLTKYILLLLAISGAAIFAGCNDGGLEEAGEDADQAIEDAGDSMQEAGEEAGEAVEEAGEEMQ